MNHNKFYKNPMFWTIVSVVYLLFLLGVVLIYNPDFSKLNNCILFVPLYVPLMIASTLHHKKDGDDSKNRFRIKVFLLAATAIVVLFKLLIDSVK